MDTDIEYQIKMRPQRLIKKKVDKREIYYQSNGRNIVWIDF